MSATAAVLIFASVVLHVGWNAISRHERPSSVFFLAAMVASAFALLPVLGVYRSEISAVLGQVGGVLVATSVLAAAYNVLLAASYRAGDLSLVYPLARSLGPVGVALTSIALGRGGEISSACLMGIAIIVVGSLLVPLDNWYDLRIERFRTPAFRYSVLTAAATAGYTLLDDHALRILRASESLTLGTSSITLLYAALHACATTSMLGLWILLVPRERRTLALVDRRSVVLSVVVGIGGYASYILVLVAMAFVSDVTYVAGFRQLGVPLSLAVGAWALSERISAPRAVGVALCAVGLLMIAVG
jgi:drug/metabolite transporter (DMT)-like permease